MINIIYHMILSVNVLREKEKGHLSCTIKVLTSYQPMSGGLTAALKHGAPAVTWLIKCRVKFESIWWRMMRSKALLFHLLLLKSYLLWHGLCWASWTCICLLPSFNAAFSLEALFLRGALILHSYTHGCYFL